MPTATPRPSRPVLSFERPSVAGWDFHNDGDYAEPADAGGYIEVQDNGLFEVAYETDQSARDMGLPSFLLTRVPVDVLRALVAAYDAKRAAHQ